MERVTGTRTTVLKSPKKFSIGDDVRSEASSLSGSVDVLAIEDINGLAVNQRVNVTGKIQSVQPAEKAEVKRLIVDCTGVIKGVAWEKGFGDLEPGCSYKLMNIT